MRECVYEFRFSDGSEAAFPVDSVGELPATPLPDWTRLGFHQCPNCPLDTTSHSHCPMAARFAGLVELGAKMSSHESVEVRVLSAERTVSNTTSVQSAVGSLMGLLSATSGCPHTAFLQAMARFHLPFANEHDTVYRVVSMYLLAQYFRAQQGLLPDWSLAQLHAHYDELQIVNVAMTERLLSISEKDGAVNALVMLDSLAKILQFSIDDALKELRPTFAAYTL